MPRHIEKPLPRDDVVLELEPVVELFPGTPTVLDIDVPVVVEVLLPLLEHCETWVGELAAMLAFIALKRASALRRRSVSIFCMHWAWLAPPGG